MLNLSPKRKLLFGALILITIAIPCIGSAAPLDLNQDSNGWTIFTPSSNSRIVYVDPSNGDDASARIYSQNDFADPFNPTSPKAYRNYGSAYAQTRNGYPDWILIKRGETITGTINLSIRSGKDSDEPFLIGAYGTSGRSPMFKTGTSKALDFGNNGKQWVAISGIQFYAHTRDPDGAGFVNSNGSLAIRMFCNSGYRLEGILLEGCKFRFYKSSTFGASGTITDIVLRRCVIYDNYDDSAHSQGLYANRTSITLEDCIFDHNGWYSKAGSSTYGKATVFNHNTYFASCSNVVFKNNIFLRGSNSHNKFTGQHISSNIVVDNNLYVDGQYVYDFGHNYQNVDDRFRNMQITNNVITQIGRSRHLQNLSWGIDIAGWSGGVISDNLLLNQEDSGINNAYGFRLSDKIQNVTIKDNILYNLMSAYGFSLRDECEDAGSDSNHPKSGIVISGNKIQFESRPDYLVRAQSNLNGYSFSNNEYYSTGTPSQLFLVGSTNLSFSQWSSGREPSASFNPIQFDDNTRDIDTYMQSLGLGASIDAFIEACRSQDRYSWDNRFTAQKVNSWIKTGFFRLVPLNLRM